VSDLPTAANVVVIGSGIVGNSVVAHLAELGWRDIVQLGENLRRCAVVMRERVRLVAVLVRHVVARVLRHLQRHLDRPVGALGSL